MKPVKSFIAALAVIFAVAVVSAADVSGTWSVDGDVASNPVKFVCTLKQAGDRLSGTAALQGKDLPVTGSVKDRTITFQFDVEHEGSTYTNVFTGKLGENTIEGTIAVGGVEGSFTAKKQK